MNDFKFALSNLLKWRYLFDKPRKYIHQFNSLDKADIKSHIIDILYISNICQYINSIEKTPLRTSELFIRFLSSPRERIKCNNIHGLRGV